LLILSVDTLKEKQIITLGNSIPAATLPVDPHSAQMVTRSLCSMLFGPTVLSRRQNEQEHSCHDSDVGDVGNPGPQVANSHFNEIYYIAVDPERAVQQRSLSSVPICLELY
jgi:hypothetical protein